MKVPHIWDLKMPLNSKMQETEKVTWWLSNISHGVWKPKLSLFRSWFRFGLQKWWICWSLWCLANRAPFNCFVFKLIQKRHNGVYGSFRRVIEGILKMYEWGLSWMIYYAYSCTIIKWNIQILVSGIMLLMRLMWWIGRTISSQISMLSALIPWNHSAMR